MSAGSQSIRRLRKLDSRGTMEDPMTAHQMARIFRLFFLLSFCSILLMAAPAAEALQGTPLPTATAATPAPTRTPAPTPTPTATLTGLQNRLLLADVYLKGGEFARAEEIYAAILAEERGHPEALAGLKKAVEGKVSATATAAAPRPTPAPAATAPAPTFGGTLAGKADEIIGTAVPILVLLLVLYLAGLVVRGLLFALREFFYLQVRPFFGRPALDRPFLIGEFADDTGLTNFSGDRLVAQTLADRLLEWNRLLQARENPVEPAPALELGGMAWIKVLWNWIVPPPRAFKVEGALWGQPTAYRLAVRRIDLSTNSVDASRTFSSAQSTPEAAFQEMAAEAAKWIVHPADMEADAAVTAGMRAARGAKAAAPLSVSEIYDEALRLLLPVRQQINQAAIDYADARDRLSQAARLLQDLPPGSALRADLQSIIADLQRHVPGA